MPPHSSSATIGAIAMLKLAAARFPTIALALSATVPRAAHLANMASTTSDSSTSVRRSNKYANDTTPKAGGDFSDAFASLSGAAPKELPARYTALKHQLVPDAHAQEELVQTWREVLSEVSVLTARIREQGGAVRRECLNWVLGDFGAHASAFLVNRLFRKFSMTPLRRVAFLRRKFSESGRSALLSSRMLYLKRYVDLPLTWYI